MRENSGGCRFAHGNASGDPDDKGSVSDVITEELAGQKMEVAGALDIQGQQPRKRLVDLDDLLGVEHVAN